MHILPEINRNTDFIQTIDKLICAYLDTGEDDKFEFSNYFQYSVFLHQVLPELLFFLLFDCLLHMFWCTQTSFAI